MLRGDIGIGGRYIFPVSIVAFIFLARRQLPAMDPGTPSEVIAALSASAQLAADAAVHMVFPNRRRMR